MKAAGIVCEYNPFHNGHLLQLEETRKLGYDHIVAVMSSHVVQRGEIAQFDKFTRAKAALACGADLVLELPAVYACASAEGFAAAAVSMLHALGVVEAVSFGSESGDVGYLQRAASFLLSGEADALIRQALGAGISYPAARQRALDTIGLQIDTPNDILGVEYCKAIAAGGGLMRPVAVRRFGAAHDGDTASDRIASASFLRSLVRRDGTSAITAYVPPKAAACYADARVADPAHVERAVLYRLRSMSPSDFAALPDVSEGLDNRLYRCARRAASLDELAMAVKTKRYTLSRIRRILFCAAVGITAADRQTPVPYLRVLAANERGRSVLSAGARARTLPLSASLAHLRGLSPQAARFAQIESSVTDLFMLACTQIYPCGLDYTTKAVII